MKNHQPLLLTNTDALAGGAYSTKLDLHICYNIVHIQHGEPLRVSFDAHSASATVPLFFFNLEIFLNLINDILQDMLGHWAFHHLPVRCGHGSPDVCNWLLQPVI